MVGATRPRLVYSLTDATPARTIWVYRNGDPFYSGRKFVINHRYVPNFEAFMIQLNEGLPMPFGVRNIYTPRYGHSVSDLPDFEQGGRYVVAGRERFKKLNYLSIGAKKPQRKKMDEVIRPVVHSNIQVPSKWQSSYNKPLSINVFTNGEMLIPPMKILIPKFTLKNWNSVLGLVNEKVLPRSGGIQRLCTLSGHSLHGPDELEDHQFYVGCGNETFKHLPYWEHPRVPQYIRRDFPDIPGPVEKPPPKKTDIWEHLRASRIYQRCPPEPTSGVRYPELFIEPPKREVRPRPPIHPLEGEGDRPSVYHAKPEKASRETTSRSLSPDHEFGLPSDQGENNVFASSTEEKPFIEFGLPSDQGEDNVFASSTEEKPFIEFGLPSDQGEDNVFASSTEEKPFIEFGLPSDQGEDNVFASSTEEKPFIEFGLPSDQGEDNVFASSTEEKPFIEFGLPSDQGEDNVFASSTEEKPFIEFGLPSDQGEDNVFASSTEEKPFIEFGLPSDQGEDNVFASSTEEKPFIEPSVYKAQQPPEEIEGAQEIQEDKDILVEMPVDQVPAEVVQEEDIYSNVGDVDEQLSEEDIKSLYEAEERQEVKAEEEEEEEEKPVQKTEKKGVFKKMFGFFFSKSKKKDTNGEYTDEQDAKKQRQFFSTKNERFDAYDYD